MYGKALGVAHEDSLIRCHIEMFQAAGANVVIAVGDAGVSWPKALEANQSTYLPR